MISWDNLPSRPMDVFKAKRPKLLRQHGMKSNFSVNLFSNEQLSAGPYLCETAAALHLRDMVAITKKDKEMDL
jgi:hypothetical protein